MLDNKSLLKGQEKNTKKYTRDIYAPFSAQCGLNDLPRAAVELRCGLCLGVCPIGKRKFKIPAKARQKKVREIKSG